MTGWSGLPARLGRRVTAVGDRGLVALSTREHRLIGLALLRIVIGAATLLYCLSDYGRRQFFWGPTSYDSPQVASLALPRWGFSLFLVNDSQLWFEFVFHLTMVVAALFMIRGGRLLTLLMAVMLWSLHYRNQDILEGGDNLAQILVIFLVFTVTNAYFAPGAKQRRARLRAREKPTFGTALHNLAAYLVLFQIAVVYLASGYWKIAGSVWQQGVAMYYISRINGFDMSGLYAHVMANPFIGTSVCYVTIFIELAFPFAVLSSRAWIRKAETLTLEAMHAGIMAFMGLVCFGLIMIGADCTALRDEDYRSLWRSSERYRARLRMTRFGLMVLPPSPAPSSPRPAPSRPAPSGAVPAGAVRSNAAPPGWDVRTGPSAPAVDAVEEAR